MWWIFPVIAVIWLIVQIGISISMKQKQKEEENEIHDMAQRARDEQERRTEQAPVPQSTASGNSSAVERKWPKPVQAPLSEEEKERIRKDNELREMREAGVSEEDLPYSETVYDTGTGYSGDLITYNSRERKFYAHEYMWHIDDSQEYLGTSECSAEDVIRLIEQVSHKKEHKIPALKRVAELTGIDVTEVIDRL